MGLRRFFQSLLNRNWQPSVPTADHSLAKTAKDALSASHTRSGAGSSTSRVYDHIAEGHENYAKSFRKKNG